MLAGPFYRNYGVKTAQILDNDYHLMLKYYIEIPGRIFAATEGESASICGFPLSLNEKFPPERTVIL